MKDLYAETVSAINFNNGVVKMVFVDQDPAKLAEKDVDPAKIPPRMKQQVIMPLPGFFYMLSVIKNLVDDPKMQKIVEKYVDIGLLPNPEQVGKGAAEAPGATEAPGAAEASKEDSSEAA